MREEKYVFSKSLLIDKLFEMLMKTEGLEPIVIKTAMKIVALLNKKTNVSAEIERHEDNSLEINLTNGEEFRSATISLVERPQKYLPSRKVTELEVKLIHGLSPFFDPPKILSEKIANDLNKIDEAAEFLNQCPDKFIYYPLGWREVVDELRKFRYGETKLTPLQHAYLHFLPDMIAQAEERVKSGNIKVELKREYSDEERDEFMEMVDEQNLDSLKCFGEIGAKIPEFESKASYIGFTERANRFESDGCLSEAAINNLLNFYLDYIEQAATAVDKYNSVAKSAANSALFKAEAALEAVLDDDYDKPDWPGNSETEEEFWEHE